MYYVLLNNGNNNCQKCPISHLTVSCGKVEYKRHCDEDITQEEPFSGSLSHCCCRKLELKSLNFLLHSNNSSVSPAPHSCVEENMLCVRAADKSLLEVCEDEPPLSKDHWPLTDGWCKRMKCPLWEGCTSDYTTLYISQTVFQNILFLEILTYLFRL